MLGAAIAGLLLAVGAIGPAAEATSDSSMTGLLSAPKLKEACTIPAFATAHYLMSSGHAISGTWTMAPKLTCTQPKTAMSISATLLRNGRAQFSSSGSCPAKRATLCTSAIGPRRTKSYGSTIQGTWSAAVVYTVSGPDAVLFAHSSPGAGTCAYVVRTLTASCHYTSAPVTIR